MWLIPLFFFSKNLALILESFSYDFMSPIVHSSSLEQMCVKTKQHKARTVLEKTKAS